MDYLFQVGGVAVEVRGGASPHPAFGHPLMVGRASARPDQSRAEARPTTTCDSRIRVSLVDDIEPPTGALLFDSGGVWKLFDGYRLDCYSPLFGEAPYKSAQISRDLREVELRIRIADLDP